MHSTVRIVVVLFLIALLVHNYHSIKVLNVSVRLLEQDIRQNVSLNLSSFAAFLSTRSLDRDALARKLSENRLAGIVLFPAPNAPSVRIPAQMPANVQESLPSASHIQPNDPIRVDQYWISGSTYTNGNQSAKFVLIFDVHPLMQLERSAKIIGYLNVFILAFAFLLAFYFIHSTIRPFRALLQAARSAPESTRRSGNNEADFLIGTFNSVIATLKEKEHELEKMHLAEKTRADEVHQLNQDLLRSISSGLILIDGYRTIRVFNNAAESLLNLPKAAAINRSYTEVLDAVSLTFRQDIDACFEQRMNINRAEMEIRANGSEARYLGANIMPLKDFHQQFAGVFCIFTDITEFKNLQQHIAQKEKFASLGEMAAGVAHQFRNSVATISGYVQMAQNKNDGDDRNYTEPIQKELQSLQRVVNDFLSFARPVELTLTAVHLEELVRDVVEETCIWAGSRKPKFVLSGIFPVVAGDEPALRQVLTNLIRNAVESTEGTGRTPVIEITGGTTANRRSLIIDIRDNGCGIAADDLPHIFTPFFSRKQNGIGLGLAIAQKFTLQHNGSITADSTTAGTSFRVQLPLQ